MTHKSVQAKKNQTGAIGVFLATALVIVFGLISLQNITTTSAELYLSNSKQNLEEARQLAFAGLRHYAHTIGSDEAINALIWKHRDDPEIILFCSQDYALPPNLMPTKQIVANPTLPNGDDRKIEILGMIAPWNCDRPFGTKNYRSTFIILASVNCSGGGNSEGFECVKRSFVYSREKPNSNYLPIKSDDQCTFDCGNAAPPPPGGGNSTPARGELGG